jgi:hypothetical protein
MDVDRLSDISLMIMIDIRHRGIEVSPLHIFSSTINAFTTNVEEWQCFVDVCSPSGRIPSHGAIATGGFQSKGQSLKHSKI